MKDGNELKKFKFESGGKGQERTTRDLVGG